jgi:hypothetical protein
VLTGRRACQVTRERTRPVIENHLGVLTRVNLTLRGSASGLLEERVRSSFDCGTDFQVTIGIECIEFNGKDTWHKSEDQSLGACVRSPPPARPIERSDPNQRSNDSILLVAL